MRGKTVNCSNNVRWPRGEFRPKCGDYLSTIRVVLFFFSVVFTHFQDDYSLSRLSMVCKYGLWCVSFSFFLFALVFFSVLLYPLSLFSLSVLSSKERLHISLELLGNPSTTCQ